VGLDHVPPGLGGLREGLKALGYEEGRTIQLDWRNLADEDTARRTAHEFVRDRVDLIVAFEEESVRAAKAATTDIPVVFLHVVTDPVAGGLVGSLAHPGGNLTGVAGDAPAKRMQLLKELVPHLQHLLVLVDADDPGLPVVLKEIRGAGAMLTIQLIERPVRTQTDVEQVFRSVSKDVEGVVIGSSGLMTKFPSVIIRLAAKNRLPVPGHRKEWAEQGALFSYGADFRSVGGDAARLVDKILKGAKPADLPVEQPTKFELVINLKTTKALGLTIPPSVLLRANHVIE
jgi:ABC-type uncharacterized transport system substrate-binding protein